jgi:hypothetical protein
MLGYFASQPTSLSTFYENYTVKIDRAYSSTWDAYTAFIGTYAVSYQTGTYYWPMGMIINYTAPYKSLTQIQCNK